MPHRLPGPWRQLCMVRVLGFQIGQNLNCGRIAHEYKMSIFLVLQESKTWSLGIQKVCDNGFKPILQNYQFETCGFLLFLSFPCKNRPQLKMIHIKTKWPLTNAWLVAEKGTISVPFTSGPPSIIITIFCQRIFHQNLFFIFFPWSLKVALNRLKEATI